MYFDGAVDVHGEQNLSRPDPPACSLFLVVIKLRFPCTNNMPEYEACIVGLEAALDMNVKNLYVSGDSILIISQLMGEWGVRSPELAK